jgi:hypothetical protein
MIPVYCENITPRHRYIFGFVFEDLLGTGLHLTDDREEFLSISGPKINYSHDPAYGGIQVIPHGLLSEESVKIQDISVKGWNEMESLLPGDGVPVWQFDPFAFAFYLITRYEEYLPFEPDEHGRFRPELSLAYREKFLEIPLVDAIFHEFKKLLQAKYPGMEIPGQAFRFIPTFDIDIAFAHLGKGWKRAVAAWVKLFLKLDFRQIKERISVLQGKLPDPYDNFSLHGELARKYGHHPVYFVLLGDFSRYDRNTSYKSERFRKLLKALSQKADIGLHPSYRSHLRPDLFAEEKRRLASIILKPVNNSRFHFLRLKFPDSCRMLISEGIRDDYSLGYSSLNGFRASTCTPFHFYDLEKEEITDLKIHPFIFMDSAMIDHLKLSPRDSISVINSLVSKVEKFGGEAIGIWHNYSLSEKDQYKGWQKVLTTILEKYKTTGL